MRTKRVLLLVLVLLFAAFVYWSFAEEKAKAPPRQLRIITPSETIECYGHWTIPQEKWNAKLYNAAFHPLTWEPDPIDPAKYHYLYLTAGDNLYFGEGGHMAILAGTKVKVRGWCKRKEKPIFRDGFESGGTGRWDQTVP